MKEDKTIIFRDRLEFESSRILLDSGGIQKRPLGKDEGDAFDSVLESRAGLPILLDLAGAAVRELS